MEEMKWDLNLLKYQFLNAHIIESRLKSQFNLKRVYKFAVVYNLNLFFKCAY